VTDIVGSTRREDPGTTAARARVAAFLEAMTRIELQVVVVAPPDATRLAARRRARDAAITAGRRTLLDDAVRVARDTTVRSFARSAFSGTWAFTEMAASVTTAADRVAAAAAFEEAVMAAVVEDLVDDVTLDTLRATSEQFGRLAGMPAPGSISAFGSPATGIQGPIQLALVFAFALLLAVVGLGTLSLVSVALGVAILAGLARRHSTSPR
jgi:hypothetical protein